MFVNNTLEQTKLIQLLASISADDMKLLRKHISAAAAGTDAERLFQYLYKLFPFHNTSLLQKEYVFAQLYAGRPYSDSRMRYLTHELMTYTEDFIADRTLAAEPFMKQMLLLRYFRERQLERHFELAYKQLKNQLEAQPLRSHDYFFYSYQADAEYNLYLKHKQNRDVEPNIQKLSDNIDAHYLLYKIDIYTEALNYKNILKVDYDIQFTDILFKGLDSDYLDRYPALALHHKALLTLAEPQQEKHFYALKDMLGAHKHLLTTPELNDLFTLARNYCIKRINKGDKQFEHDLFDLYQQEIAQIDETDQLEISPMLYKNVVTLAINIGEAKWIKSFTERYQSKLPEPHRKSLYSFNMAKYWFTQRKYGRVIELLSDVEYIEMFDQLAAKSILLKAYFEQEEVQAFESLVHSFRVLLGNKKDLGYHGKSYLNFAGFAEKLFLADDKKKKALLAKMSTVKELVERKWLLEKATNH